MVLVVHGEQRSNYKYGSYATNAVVALAWKTHVVSLGWVNFPTVVRCVSGVLARSFGFLLNHCCVVHLDTFDHRTNLYVVHRAIFQFWLERLESLGQRFLYLNVYFQCVCTLVWKGYRNSRMGHAIGQR